MDERQQQIEWLKCSKSFPYFVDQYIKIYDAIAGDWLPFKLWPLQIDAANAIESHRLVLVLKARQLGITWLSLAYLLWLMIFRAASTVMLFSRRETEAGYLMWRLRGMYERIPKYMQTRQTKTNNTLTMILSNGSAAYAFPTTAGDSYTASAVLVDEADLVPDLDTLMSSVKPTIDAGGKMLMISRSNKEKPTSPFKNLFRGAMKGVNNWYPVFLPWTARPDRTQEWYDELKNEIMSRTMSLDELYEQYPATPEEALKAIELDKRFSSSSLEAVSQLMVPIETGTLPGLKVFVRPSLARRYVIGADPAEGNPRSDDSSASVLDLETGEEMAQIKGKIEPVTFAGYLEKLSKMYNNAMLMVERNNHGHVVIAVIDTNILLKGQDGKFGWHTNTKSKSDMYSHAVDVITGNGCVIHSQDTLEQLLSIEGSLKAPEGLNDDCAVSYCLGLLSIDARLHVTFSQNYQEAMYRPINDPRRVRLGMHIQ